MNYIRLTTQSVEDILYLRDFNRADGEDTVKGLDELISYFIEKSVEITRDNDAEAHQMLDRIRFVSSIKDIIYNLSKEE